MTFIQFSVAVDDNVAIVSAVPVLYDNAQVICCPVRYLHGPVEQSWQTQVVSSMVPEVVTLEVSATPQLHGHVPLRTATGKN